MSDTLTTPRDAVVGEVGSGRFDVRAMMQHLAPFRATEPWKDIFIPCATRNGEITEVRPWTTILPSKPENAVAKAIKMMEAIDPFAVLDAEDDLDQAMKPPLEVVVRAVLGMMLSTLRSKPTEGADKTASRSARPRSSPQRARPGTARHSRRASPSSWGAPASTRRRSRSSGRSCAGSRRATAPQSWC